MEDDPGPSRALVVRRLGMRFATRAPAVYTTGGAHTFCAAWARSLGPGDVRLLGGAPAAPGSILRVGIELPDGPFIRLIGWVVWARAIGGCPGADLGVRFVPCDGDSARALDRWLRARPAHAARSCLEDAHDDATA